MGDSEELKPLGTWGARIKAVLVLVLKYAVPAVAALLSAYHLATKEARERATEAKVSVEAQTKRVEQKAEAVLQVTRPKASESDARLLRLEQAVQAIQAQLERPSRRRPAPPPVAIRPVMKPRQLPANAEAALKQIHPQVPTPAVPPAAVLQPQGTGRDGH